MNLNFNKVCIVALLVVCLTIIPASATITLSGVKLMTDVAPGGTIQYPMTLTSSNTDTAIDYDFTVLGFGNTADGSYTGIDPATDTSPQSARPYITLDKSVVNIAPGSSATVTATVAVPPSATGGLYALINIHPKTAPTNGASATVVTAMNVPVMLTVTGTPVTETGAITSITAEGYNIVTKVKNTGNHHYYGLENTVTVADTTGNQVFRLTSDPLVTAIVPGEFVTFVQPVNANIPAGEYHVASSASIGVPSNALAMNLTQIVLTPSGTMATATPLQTQGNAEPTTVPTTAESPGFDVSLAVIGLITIIYLTYNKS